MDVRALEIRDRATLVPALAIRLEPGTESARYLLARAGFGTAPEAQGRFVLLVKVGAPECNFDPWEWRDRTMAVAHRHILDSFDDLVDGSVVDVEYLLGETAAPKQSESREEASP